jgi:baculoviral IAP repeat-containing protein 6
MGLEAVSKQKEAKVFIAGVNAMGIEIAKNIVLSGVKKLTIFDSAIVNIQDLCG